MDDQNNQPDKCLSRRQTEESREYAFLIRPSLLLEGVCNMAFSREAICKNRIMPLFDHRMMCAKTPSEYLASGRLLCSTALKEIRYGAEYPLVLHPCRAAAPMT